MPQFKATFFNHGTDEFEDLTIPKDSLQDAEAWATAFAEDILSVFWEGPVDVVSVTLV